MSGSHVSERSNRSSAIENWTRNNVRSKRGPVSEWCGSGCRLVLRWLETKMHPNKPFVRYLNYNLSTNGKNWCDLFVWTDSVQDEVQVKADEKNEKGEMKMNIAWRMGKLEVEVKKCKSDDPSAWFRIFHNICVCVNVDVKGLNRISPILQNHDINIMGKYEEPMEYLYNVYNGAMDINHFFLGALSSEVGTNLRKPANRTVVASLAPCTGFKIVNPVGGGDLLLGFSFAGVGSVVAVVADAVAVPVTVTEAVAMAVTVALVVVAFAEAVVVEF
ncbi:hypothetical protein Ahy_B03g065561 [Arachis hypogaea]|uniref:Uncharacterized protein n=1 Tax=Arachis hypogaea TaxID=3818 RepID=A0A445A246_ARAHY|nr:hypothetical protein Ahy_B03g065561 [Arachis hypogaea]